MGVDYNSYLLYGLRLPYTEKLMYKSEDNGIEYVVDYNGDFIYLGEFLSNVSDYKPVKSHEIQDFYSDEDTLYSELKNIFDFKEEDFGVWHVFVVS